LSSSDASLQERRKVLRLAKIDTIAALNVALFVNAAMLVVAGTIFFQHVDPASLDLQTAYVTLVPALGVFAGIAFGWGCLPLAFLPLQDNLRCRVCFDGLRPRVLSNDPGIASQEAL
jgi:Mn2+/Fe2+ NRAMP family transporter